MKKEKGHIIRAAIVSSFFILWLGVIGARAAYLQLYKGTWLSNKAAGQYEREMVLPGKRGTIYDSRHQAMAVSIETTSIAAYPAAVEDHARAAADLAPILNLKSKELMRLLGFGTSIRVDETPGHPKQVDAVKKLGLKGVAFLPEHSRFIPTPLWRLKSWDSPASTGRGSKD
jgi:cell division protein FtsI (penicillin-binding protein 3)